MSSKNSIEFLSKLRNRFLVESFVPLLRNYVVSKQSIRIEGCFIAQTM